MIFSSFLIPEGEVAKFRIVIDECNEIRPIPLQEGPDKGSYFLDTDIVNRFPQLDKLLGTGKRSPLIISKQLDTTIISKPLSVIRDSK